MTARRACGVAVFLAVSTPRIVAAECPRLDAPADPTCRPWSALFLPTVAAMVYAPGEDAMGPWAGGGLEVVFFAWSDSSPAAGPSQGKVRFDIGLLGSGKPDAGAMVLYRGGVQVSIERNPSRRWLIPYVGADIGGLWTDGLGTRGFVDGVAGLYLWHQRAVIVDVELGALLPFADPELLAGPRAQLALSLALW